MKLSRCYLGTSLITFGAGLLLSCLIPPFVLVCLLAGVITATGFLIYKR